MPKGIRPTQGKVRKALFDILGDIQGLSFLELFSGSGAVGFEAVSQGAKQVVFVENNSGCIKALKNNFTYLLPTTYYLLPLDVFMAIKKLSKDKKQFDIIFLDPPYYRPEGRGLASDKPEGNGLASFGQSHSQSHRPEGRGLASDKPEGNGLASFGQSHSQSHKDVSKKILQMLGVYDILAPNGFVAIQHFKKEQLPKESGKLILVKESRYGDTVLSFYKKIGVSV